MTDGTDIKDTGNRAEITDKTGKTDAAEERNINTAYAKMHGQKIAVIAVTVILLILAMIFAAASGSVYIPPSDIIAVLLNSVIPGITDSAVNENTAMILFNLRLPRIFLAALAGVCLALAGAVMQALLRNPLVSPFTLGLSSAASFGAAFMIVLGPIVFGSLFKSTAYIFGYTLSMNSVLMIFSAFIFGWMSVSIIYLLSHSRSASQSIIILSGVVIGYIFQAGLLAMQYISSDESLRDIVIWLMGGMWGASWQAVIILFPIALACFILMEMRAWKLNTLSAGDDVAKNLGINVAKFRIQGLLIVSFGASACLAFTGVIGFVGLMAPHICRMIIGNDNRYLIPCAAAAGALILVVSDTLARIVLAPIELPVGIIMYLIGGVFFIYLIVKGRGAGLE
ncbi:MAG: iron ABC transporter permease [Methanomicrobium sp.]|nr:iron ABC transporter permease [Methanomicrobium sp.]MBQ3718268.1 iron ABC transporter permease [Methanomicrobium sp.]